MGRRGREEGSAYKCQVLGNLRISWRDAKKLLRNKFSSEKPELEPQIWEFPVYSQLLETKRTYEVSEEINEHPERPGERCTKILRYVRA